MKKHIKIAVEIPTTDKDNELIIEPGTGDVIVLSDASGFKVGVTQNELIDAIYALRTMKLFHLPNEEEAKSEPQIGEILEGDEE